jgi:hypothetical protein
VLAERVAAALKDPPVDYRHVFIDNASTDVSPAGPAKRCASWPGKTRGWR